MTARAPIPTSARAKYTLGATFFCRLRSPARRPKFAGDGRYSPGNDGRRIATAAIDRVSARAYEAQAAEIRGHGGEILKFIGDGLLAIFPITETDAVAAIAKAAVAAARKAIAAVADLARHPEMRDEPPLNIVVALHVGTVHYGNIGAADRLDFTVIGPAVNLVSRIENAAKTLGQPIVVSAELAATLDGVVSLGRHQLRGLATPHELFARSEQLLQPASIRQLPLLAEASDVSRADACSCRGADRQDLVIRPMKLRTPQKLNTTSSQR
jgi:class 3 adenylate cyclase